MYDNVRQHLRMIRSGGDNVLQVHHSQWWQNNTEVLDSMPYNYHLQKMFQKMTVSLM